MYWLFFGSLGALLGLTVLKAYENGAGKMLFAQDLRRRCDRVLVNIFTRTKNSAIHAGRRIKHAFKQTAHDCAQSTSKILRRIAQSLEK